MKEIWKKITRFPHISVSSLGNIRNDNTNRIYKLSLSGYNDVGYLFTTIRPDGRNGKGIPLYAHIEVAKAFIENKENKPTVNHINGIKTDNRLENLEWATMQEQQVHAIKVGLRRIRRGEEVHNSILSEEQVHRILSEPEIKNYVWAEKFGVHKNTISDVRNGVKWKQIYSLYKGVDDIKTP